MTIVNNKNEGNSPDFWYTPMETDSIERLPFNNEMNMLFQLVFEKLTFREQGKLKGVCQEFKRLVEENESKISFLQFNHPSEAELSQIAQMTGLKILIIENRIFKSEEGVHFPIGLEELTLRGDEKGSYGSRLDFFDDGAEPFSEATQLQHATFNGQIMPNSALRSLPISLVSLDLQNSATCSNFIKAIAHLSNLEELNLSFTAITDQGISEIVNTSMPKLKKIHLEQTFVSGPDVLADHPNRDQLELIGPTAPIAYSVSSYQRYTPNYSELYYENYNTSE